MHMGRERYILRWDVRHWLLAQHLDAVEAQLARLGANRIGDPRMGAAGASDAPAVSDPGAGARREALLRERDELRARIQALGPSPRAKME
jgi:hypothetical protein